MPRSAPGPEAQPGVTRDAPLALTAARKASAPQSVSARVGVSARLKAQHSRSASSQPFREAAAPPRGLSPGWPGTEEAPGWTQKRSRGRGKAALLLVCSGSAVVSISGAVTGRQPPPPQRHAVSHRMRGEAKGAAPHNSGGGRLGRAERAEPAQGGRGLAPSLGRGHTAPHAPRGASPAEPRSFLGDRVAE